jgi:hypothetical protein
VNGHGLKNTLFRFMQWLITRFNHRYEYIHTNKSKAPGQCPSDFLNTPHELKMKANFRNSNFHSQHAIMTLKYQCIITASMSFMYIPGLIDRAFSNRRKQTSNGKSWRHFAETTPLNNSSSSSQRGNAETEPLWCVVLWRVTYWTHASKTDRRELARCSSPGGLTRPTSGWKGLYTFGHPCLNRNDLWCSR